MCYVFKFKMQFINIRSYITRNHFTLMQLISRLSYRKFSINLTKQFFSSGSTKSVKVLTEKPSLIKKIIEVTDFHRTVDNYGLWGHYGRHYNIHGIELMPIHLQMIFLVSLVIYYAYYGFRKIEIEMDRSWYGGNRNYIYHAIEDRFDYEYAFAFDVADEPPPKLKLMRRLQKEMYLAAAKRGTLYKRCLWD